MHRDPRRLSLAFTTALVALILGACAQAPSPVPTLTLETLSNWWATTPEAELADFSTLRMEFTFENTTGGPLDFVGDGGGADPAAELQLWTVPSVDDPGVTFTTFPESSYADGATMSWDILIDLGTVAAGETGIAIRPNTSAAGTLGPGSLDLVDSTLTLER